MYELQLDNRILNNLRQNMSGSIVDEDGLITLSQFRQLFMSFFKESLWKWTSRSLGAPEVQIKYVL